MVTAGEKGDSGPEYVNVDSLDEEEEEEEEEGEQGEEEEEGEGEESDGEREREQGQQVLHYNRLPVCMDVQDLQRYMDPNGSNSSQ